MKELITRQTNFTAENPNLVNVLYSDIWEKITSGTAEQRPIKGNLLNDYQYETREYNILYQNTLSRFIADKFSGDLKHGSSGSSLTFLVDKFQNYEQLYGHKTGDDDSDVNIEVRLDKSEGSEGSEGFNNGYDNKNNQDQEENEKINPSPEPSEPSEPSSDVRVRISPSRNGLKPELVTCQKCGIVSEPFYMRIHKCESID